MVFTMLLKEEKVVFTMLLKEGRVVFTMLSKLTGSPRLP